MASRFTFEITATNTILLILVLLESVLMLDKVMAAPLNQNNRNDILAGTEFLSVFINGAMAPVPVGQLSSRRRGFRRGGGPTSNQHSTIDSVAAESRQSEAPIYRISRAPSSPRPFVVSRAGGRDQESIVRFYPINQKEKENVNQEPENSGNLVITSIKKDGRMQDVPKMGSENDTESSVVLLKTRLANVSQKVIGVSVTSSVEATPYKVRVEHHDNDKKINLFTRPPMAEKIPTQSFPPPTRMITSKTSTTYTAMKTTDQPITTKSTKPVTQLPAQLVTEELNNIVSESNRSEFTVEESQPKTSWPKSPTTTTTATDLVTSESPMTGSMAFTAPRREPNRPNEETPNDSLEAGTMFKPSGQRYEVSIDTIKPESPLTPYQQGRKVGRQYDAIIYNPEIYTKMYGNNYADIYSEPSKIYGEPSKIYGEPSKIYGEPSKVYGEPEKIYGEPSKIYSEPSRVYGEPSKVYGEPSKVYGEPSKIYGADGRPVLTHHRNNNNNHNRGEPVEENYEIDEAVSVGSNGNVHGLQIVTESPKAKSTEKSNSANDSVGDNHKVGYVVDERNYRKYRVEERTPDGFIVGEYGVVSHDDGSLRGVRYTADGTIDPRLIYDALMKFLAL